MQVVVATKNRGKLEEFSRILAPYGVTAVGMEDIDLHDDIVEDGETFLDNARIKALAIHRVTGLPVIADDSGLCVDALEGRPGVHTARYGGDVSYAEKMAMLLREMEHVPDGKRTARFVCAIYFIIGERGNSFLGSCPGVIGYEPRGEKGFGFDPVFYVGEKSFSELPDEEKDAISHRGKALRAFAQNLPEILNTNKNTL